MRTNRFGLAIVLAMLTGPCFGQSQLEVKQVAAPPSEIRSQRHALPDQTQIGVTSRSALIEIQPEQFDNNINQFSLALSDRGGRIVFMPALDGAWSTEIRASDGRTINASDPQVVQGMSLTKQHLPWGDGRQRFECIDIKDNAGGGLVASIDFIDRVGGYILYTTNPDEALYTYIETQSTLVSKPIKLVSSITDGSAIENLSAVVSSPTGELIEIPSQRGSNETVFTPSVSGAYAVRVECAYRDSKNLRKVLTTQHLIQVEQPTAAMGDARVDVVDHRLVLNLATGEPDRRVIVAAEVWGRSKGEMIPVCWLSRVCDDQRSLAIDLRWIALAGADPQSLELRSLRMHDVDSFVPLQVIDRMTLDVPAIQLPEVPQSITPDMLQSNAPDRVRSPIGFDQRIESGALPGGHRLLLVHGYCSDGNPFTASHFTGDIAIFDDPFVSKSTDAFALEILAQTSSMKSFGVAAHSQGAMAALHLSTYYFSGLDWARGERLIQSVGAPYQGTALAGNAAVLGDIFGFGCGENADMTYTGAANWLSLIPTLARQSVWYSTTSFEDRPFAFDYCNFITDLLLSDPDDGVIERSAGQLPGAHNEGHLEGWCHTTGMRDPAQCSDLNRNQQINARARR